MTAKMDLSESAMTRISKTAHTELLERALKEGSKPAILLRNYLYKALGLTPAGEKKT